MVNPDNLRDIILRLTLISTISSDWSQQAQVLPVPVGGTGPGNRCSVMKTHRFVVRNSQESHGVNVGP